MATEATKHSSELIEPSEVRWALDKIFGSRYFHSAPTKQRFVRLLCDFYLEGRAQELNEYVIAYEVFGRNETYDPATDSIVRVIASKVREKLELYYRNEGATDAVHLEIPPGSYQPVFRKSAYDSPPDVTGDASRSFKNMPLILKRLRFTSQTAWLSIAIVALLILVIDLAFSNREMRKRLDQPHGLTDPAAYGEVWLSFLKDASPPLVVLSTPRVAPVADNEAAAFGDQIGRTPRTTKVVWTGAGGLNTDLPTRPAIVRALETRITAEEGHTAPPSMNTNLYTGMGEAIGLYHLTDFFRATGKTITVKQSRTLSAEDIKDHNVILLGGAGANEWAGKLGGGEDFVCLSTHSITNRNPLPGEEREYVQQFSPLTGGLSVDYALITVKPNVSGPNTMMTLSGISSPGTQAAVEYVTKQNYLEHLNQHLAELVTADGPAQHFQALLRVVVENGIPTRVSVIAAHRLRQSGW